MDAAQPQSRRWPAARSSAPDVGLVLAAAMAPGTFAPSLSSRTALDQGLVTGLATGLHFLLAAGAQDALGATARFLTGGAPSPAGMRTATIAVDAAAVPVGLAVLRALRSRADDPVRGIVRQAAWRLGATGLSGALLGGAQAGAQALDDRLGLRGRLAAVPLALPVGLGIAYAVDRVRAGEDAERTDGAAAPPLSSFGVAAGIVGCLAGAAYGEHALTDLLARRLAAVLPGPPELWRLAGHAGFLLGLGLGASTVWHRAMHRIEAVTSADVPVLFQSLVDMKNAQTAGPFGANQHDYRADLPRFLSDVYGLPASEEQLLRIEETLQVRETVRERLFAVVPGAVG
jgi:hypothetical protein